MLPQSSPISAIVYPKVRPEEADTTAVTPAQRRRRAELAGATSADAIRLWGESHGRQDLRARAYRELGLKQIAAGDPVRTGPGEHGVVLPLTTLGGDIIRLLRGRDDLETLNDRLGEHFIVSATDPSRLASETATQGIDAMAPAYCGPPERFGHRYPYSGVSDAHNAEKPVTGRGIVCAALDTGVDANHQDFAHRGADQSISFGFVHSPDRMEPAQEGCGFDLHGHGTHVCSIIGGAMGVAPEVTLVAAGSPKSRMFNSVVMFSIGLDWLFAQIEAEQQFRRRIILNLSLGFLPPDEFVAPDGARYDRDAYNRELSAFDMILSQIIKQNVLVVAAIGNQAGTYRLPGGRPDVLSVGALTHDHNRAPYSGHVPQTGHPDRIGPRIMGYGHNIIAADRLQKERDHL